VYGEGEKVGEGGSPEDPEDHQRGSVPFVRHNCDHIFTSTKKIIMIITNDMRAVIIRIQRTKIDPNCVSPNLVADIACSMDKKLTSEQIVYISDNY